MLVTLTVLLALAAGLAVFARWVEPRVAFVPTAGESLTPADFGMAYSAIDVTASDGQRIHAWLLRASAAKALVVYFHGNGGNLSVWSPIVAEIARRGFDVLAFDYRGYGVSTGRPTEAGVYRDADAVIDRAWALADRSRPVVYWGRSLGTAVAAHAATQRPPGGIILEAGFPDARTLLRTSPILALLARFSTYRFPTADSVNRARVPALVIHGDADTIVPFGVGEALFARLNTPKTFVRIHDGDHNDTRPADPNLYWSAVDAFIAQLADEGRAPRQ